MASQDFVRSMPGAAVVTAPSKGPGFGWDPILLFTLLLIVGFGLTVLFSALDGNRGVFNNQVIRIAAGFVGMLIAAQFSPRFYLRLTPLFYALSVILVALVLVIGVKVKGSQRWLEIPGLLRFQPSELLKVAVPMMVAWYFHERALPPSFRDLVVAMLIIAAPAACIVVQPDLGTSILVACAGGAVVLLAGLYWRWIFYAAGALAAAAPALWFTLQDYQKQRILTLIDPQSDPLGAGWNIIQSTTAIGSGGFYGKGLFQGTQSHLDFLPESQTDFIIAVIGEELGFLGVCLLLVLYLAVIGRGLYIASQATQTFSRLLAGALTLTFFVYVFVNIAMVSGMLPVVGVPLPLVSYGGTSALTLLASFGIIMSIRSHRGW